MVPHKSSISTNEKGGRPIKPASRASVYGEKDVWAIFSPLALQHNAGNAHTLREPGCYFIVNLGQGFPNLPAPGFVKQAACDAINSNLNQYAPSRGLARLRQVLAKYNGKSMGRELDPDSEILVTSGANQAISVVLQAFLEPGDEVILIEPYFDIYKPAIQIAGGRVVAVPLRLGKQADPSILHANDWKLDMEELRAAITPRTKAVLLNTPHNPTGKVFSKAELEELAGLVITNNLMVISDEVYEQVYFEERPARIAMLPGMWERTITIGSTGKTFGVTGWRIGWTIGPKELLKYVLAIHARTVFTAPTPLQEASAVGFELAEQNGHFDKQRQQYKQMRDKLLSVFDELGLPAARPAGSYFFMVETSKIKVSLPVRSSEESSDPAAMEPHDYALCRWLTTQIGVTAIPPSAFYEEEHKGLAHNWLRFCFCKTDETLDAARERLLKLKQYIRS